MYWNYFNESGKFKAKKLPAPKGGVRMKDYTDLSLLRSELKECKTFDEGVFTYQHLFDDPDYYEIGVEPFFDWILRAPRKFFPGLEKLHRNKEIKQELILWWENDISIRPTWLYVDK